MKIEKISINKINPAVYNPRKDLQPDDPEYKKLKKSIAEFGYVDPLIWNEATGNLVGGHQRMKILKEQGIQEIEVSIVNLSLEKEKSLNLALNKISGCWDNDKLAALLDELVKLPDFDVSLSGFDMPEISKIFDSYLDSAIEDVFENPQAITEPITKQGDLILLGSHRILCGDSSDPDDVASLVEDKKANLIFSDPPYSVDYATENRPVRVDVKTNTGERWRKILNDNLPQKDYEKWLKKVFVNINPYLAQGTPFYIFNGHKQFGPMYQILQELGLHVSCVITWAKESFSPGYGDYNQQTEFCLYGWKEDNGAHNWYGPKNESTLWQVHREQSSTLEHPTQKPLLLAERAIRNSSKRGDAVLDMFLGSGTTLIAAEKLSRLCYGMELDPRYCDCIVRRYIRVFGVNNVSEEIKNRYIGEVKNGL